MTEAICRGEWCIEQGALTEDEVSQIQIALTYMNPAHLAAMRRGADARFIEPRLTALRLAEGHWRVPRGALGVLRRVLGDRLLPIDGRSTGASQFWPLRETMRPHQFAAGDALVRAQQGLVLGATGAGKTGAACVAISRCALPALWIAPTLDLAHQAHHEIGRFLGVDAAMSVGGKLAIGPITIATWPTARKHLDQLRRAFGLLVVDEVHGALADTRLEVVRAIEARYRLGITATAKREDVRSPLLGWHFGRVLYQFGIDQGVGAGILAAPKWRDLRSELRFPYIESSDWQPLLAHLFSDVARASLVADDVAADAHGGLALVLSTRKDHLALMHHFLTARGVRAELLTGDLAKKKREEVIARARTGAIEALLCTQLADEGLDLVSADRLYLTAPSKSETRLLQRIGRIVRAAPGKRRPEVIDVVDHHVGVLDHQARKRRRIFEQSWGDAVRGAA